MKSKAGLFGIVCLCLMTSLALPVGAYEADDYLGHLSSAFNRHDDKLNDYLVAELESFIQIYPSNPLLPEAHLMLGRAHSSSGDQHDAIAIFARGAFLFPSSALRGEYRDEIRPLLIGKGEYKAKLDVLLAELEEAPSDTLPRGLRHSYVEFLSKLPPKKHHDRLIVESALFARDFPRDPRIVIHQLWCGLSYANIGKERAGVVTLEKLETLSPASELVPLARFYRADILHRNLGEHHEAIGILDQIIEQYPDSRQVPDALDLRAEIKRRKTKDPSGAIKDYLTLKRNHGDHAKADDGMYAAAKIALDTLKDYRAAIAHFNEFAEAYASDPRAREGMKKAAELYRDKLKDYQAAADQFVAAAEKFDDSDYAVAMLMAAAKVHEDKTKRYGAANTLYQTILAKYETHEKVDDVKKKISKNQERTGGRD